MGGGEITVERRDGDPWLILSGDIDMSTVDAYADGLTGGLSGHTSDDDLWVDLSEVEFMDSSGLSVLFRARNVARAVHLINAPRR